MGEQLNQQPTPDEWIVDVADDYAGSYVICNASGQIILGVDSFLGTREEADAVLELMVVGRNAAKQANSANPVAAARALKLEDENNES